MNILIVKYLPSGENSNTLKLLEHFKTKINKAHKIEELDLEENPPKIFDKLTMNAYKRRNYGGETIDNFASNAIRPMDNLVDQFTKADFVILVTPMHNFSLPGIVKIYFDAIMQNGKVFKYENNMQIGLMKHLKFLTLYTSMGSYNGEFGFLDNLKTIVKIELDFMGINEYEFVHASTGNATTKDIHLRKASEILDTIIARWRL